MKLLDYQIDDVRQAVRELVKEHAHVNFGGDGISWNNGPNERQAIQDLVDKIDEIIHPNQWRR